MKMNVEITNYNKDRTFNSYYTFTAHGRRAKKQLQEVLEESRGNDKKIITIDNKSVTIAIESKYEKRLYCFTVRFGTISKFLKKGE